MEWSKIKTIILLMLVCANAALLALVFAREGLGLRYADETKQSAVQVLEQNGIQLLPQQVPEDISYSTLNLTRDRSGEEAIARLLLGDVTSASESDVRHEFLSEKGSMEFSMNGSFQVEFAQGAWLREKGESYEEASQRFLSQLDFTGQWEASEAVSDGTLLTYCQVWSKVPVFSCQVSLLWQGDELRHAQGQRLAGTAAAEGSAQPLSTTTILIRFLSGLSQNGFVCSQIEAMDPGYRANGTVRTAQLLPVWRIQTDSGNYYVDALSGEVSQAP